MDALALSFGCSQTDGSTCQIDPVRLVRVTWGDKERRETKGKGLRQCIERVN
jgi:hypothetical protein